jgi:hypothetical protein
MRSAGPLPWPEKNWQGWSVGRWRQHPPERQSRLEALHGWTWSSHDDAWEIGFAHLSDYNAANGNCLVPAAYTLADGYKLGRWVGIQRRTQVKMHPERQSRLEALRDWTWNSKGEASSSEIN